MRPWFCAELLVTTTVQRPQDLIDDVLVACLGTSRRRIDDEVPAVDAFVKLISLQESLLDIDFVQLHIICEDIMRRATARPGVGEKLST